MPQQELLIDVAKVLEALQIEYMLTGSLASSILGVPRATHDIDLVVHLRMLDVSRLLSHFQPPRFYASEDAARDAVRTRSMFNVIDTTSGDKVDFWIPLDTAFDALAHSRRTRVALESIELPVPTPEDLVIFKLRWAKAANGSSKQMSDIVGILHACHPTLDVAYIDHWAHLLELDPLWLTVRPRT